MKTILYSLWHCGNACGSLLEGGMLLTITHVIVLIFVFVFVFVFEFVFVFVFVHVGQE